MSWLLFLYRRFYIFFICVFLWILGLGLLYPLWLISQKFSNLFLFITSFSLSSFLLFSLFRYLRTKTIKVLFRGFLVFLKYILLFFFLVLSCVAFYACLWWQMSVALAFCFCLLCVTIPHAGKKL